MVRRLLNHRQRELLTGILLVALAFRALIPAGYMPASNQPFALAICHAGFFFHAGQPGDDHQSGGNSHSDICPYGSAPAGGPSPYVAAQPAAWLRVLLTVSDLPSTAVLSRSVYSHQPRGPPVLA